MGVDYKRDAPLLVFNFVSALAIISSNKVNRSRPPYAVSAEMNY